MSLAKLLGHLHSGNAIIIRDGGDALLRVRPQFFLQGLAGTMDGQEGAPHKLLRSLIAARRRGGKK